MTGNHHSGNGAVADRVAFVTGAGSGIGRAICVRLAEEGAHVIVTSRTRAHVEATCAEVKRASGHEPASMVLDVADRPAVAEAVRAGAREHGRIDILSNNAGIELPVSRSVEETTDEEWDEVLRVNLTGSFATCRAALPAMGAGGSVINMASIVSIVAFPNDSAYIASKGALLQFTRALALEAGPRGIRANCVCPGAIDTPLTTALYAREADPSAARAAECALSPFDRLGTAREVANCVLFLASAESSFVTGTALIVDGGATAQ